MQQYLSFEETRVTLPWKVSFPFTILSRLQEGRTSHKPEIQGFDLASGNLYCDKGDAGSDYTEHCFTEEHVKTEAGHILTLSLLKRYVED